MEGDTANPRLYEVEMTQKEERVIEAIKTILRYIGEDPNREGLRDTPERVVRSWDKLFGGYKQAPDDVLKTDFSSDGYDQMIVLEPIEFWSTCEHHMLPFSGTVAVGYIPGASGKVVGISKLARLVEVYSRRLQIQERFTKQIADALAKTINPLGVAVVVRAKHMCMVARGVEKQQSWMSTSAMRGAFRDNQSARDEFLSLARSK
jgi:GTP cyclohydrolase I